MKSLKERTKRHMGTYYFAGPLLGIGWCGHKHATVRAAMKCKRDWVNPRIFVVTHGMLPARIMD